MRLISVNHWRQGVRSCSFALLSKELLNLRIDLSSKNTFKSAHKHKNHQNQPISKEFSGNTSDALLDVLPCLFKFDIPLDITNLFAEAELQCSRLGRSMVPTRDSFVKRFSMIGGAEDSGLVEFFGAKRSGAEKNPTKSGAATH